MQNHLPSNLLNLLDPDLLYRWYHHLSRADVGSLPSWQSSCRARGCWRLFSVDDIGFETKQPKQTRTFYWPFQLRVHAWSIFWCRHRRGNGPAIWMGK